MQSVIANTLRPFDLYIYRLSAIDQSAIHLANQPLASQPNQPCNHHKTAILLVSQAIFQSLSESVSYPHSLPSFPVLNQAHLQISQPARLPASMTTQDLLPPIIPSLQPGISFTRLPAQLFPQPPRQPASPLPINNAPLHSRSQSLVIIAIN